MRILPLASLVLAALATVAAHADTISFASAPGVTTYTYAAGSGLLKGTSGNAAAVGFYGTPIAGSQWVSTDANGGSNFYGVTNYTNTFTLLQGQSYAGSITFLADDYAGILVNGVEVFAISGTTGYINPTTINLLPSYFTAGVNTISVEAFNTGGPGGADFAGTLTGTSVTPEPSTLLLLGTGLLGVAGAARRRFLAA